MRLSRLGPVALTLAILLAALYLYRDDISLSRFIERMAGLSLVPLAFAAIFFAIAIGGTSARYRYIIQRMTGTKVSLTYLLLLSNFSFACGYVAPVSVTTEVLRVAFTKTHLNIDYSQSIRLVIVDKLLGLAGVALVSLAFIPIKLAYGINRDLIVVEGAALICVFMVIFLLPWLISLMNRAPMLKLHTERISEDARFIVGNLLNVPDMVRFLFYTVVAVGGFGVGTIFVAQAVHFDAAPGLIFILSPTVLLVQNAPMFYAGFGAREAVLLAALHTSAQIDPNVVLGFSVMIGIMLLVAAVPPSLLFIVNALNDLRFARSDAVTKR